MMLRTAISARIPSAVTAARHRARGLTSTSTTPRAVPGESSPSSTPGPTSTGSSTVKPIQTKADSGAKIEWQEQVRTSVRVPTFCLPKFCFG